jgi:hypothetical protein
MNLTVLEQVNVYDVDQTAGDSIIIGYNTITSSNVMTTTRTTIRYCYQRRSYI